MPPSRGMTTETAAPAPGFCRAEKARRIRAAGFPVKRVAKRDPATPQYSTPLYQPFAQAQGAAP